MNKINILVISILLLLQCSISHAITVFSEDFDSLESITDKFDYSGNETTEIVEKEGRTCMRSYLNRLTQDNDYRTEVTFDTSAFGSKNELFNKVYTLSFYFFIDENFVYDTTPEIFCQLHGVPDVEEEYRSPNIALQMQGENDDTKYSVVVRGDTKALTPPLTGRYTTNIETDLGSISEDIGKWVSWRIEYYLTYEDDAGYVKIFKNNTLIFNMENIETAFNDDIGPYWKFGVYKWEWADGANLDSGADIRINYYDDIYSATENRILISGLNVSGLTIGY